MAAAAAELGMSLMLACFFMASWAPVAVGASATTGLRFFTVYGPWGRPDMAAWIFADKILAGKPIEVFNNGDMHRDFTYIDDIVQGVPCTVTNRCAYT